MSDIALWIMKKNVMHLVGVKRTCGAKIYASVPNILLTSQVKPKDMCPECREDYVRLVLEGEIHD